MEDNNVFGSGSGSGAGQGSPPSSKDDHHQASHPRTWKSTDEYANAVNVWLQQCHYWHTWMRTSAAFLVGQQLLTLQQQQYLVHGRSSATATTSTPNVGRNAPPSPPAAAPLDRRGWTSIFERLLPVRAINAAGARVQYDDGNAVDPSAVPVLSELGGREYMVPNVWKRFLAEFVDFTILFLLKLFITFVIMDFFDVLDMDKYDLGSLQSGGTLDYKFALKLTSEIFVLEMIHRVIVCFFEALCLHQGTNGVGGATPGKSLLGLRVISCETIVSVRNGRIVVWPAADMGFVWALLRSVIKNFAMAFFLPACITMFFFPFHRTIYDILCGCIVVEDIRHAARP